MTQWIEIVNWIVGFFDTSRWWWWVIAPMMGKILYIRTDDALTKFSLEWSLRRDNELLRSAPPGETHLERYKRDTAKRPLRYEYASGVASLIGWAYFVLSVVFVYYTSPQVSFANAVMFTFGVVYLVHLYKTQSECEDEISFLQDEQSRLGVEKVARDAHLDERKKGYLSPQAYKIAIEQSAEDPSEVHENYRKAREEMLIEEIKSRPKPIRLALKRTPDGPPKSITVRKNGRLTELELNEVECELAKAAFYKREPSTEDAKALAAKLRKAARSNLTEGLSEVEMELVRRIRQTRREGIRQAIGCGFILLVIAGALIWVAAWYFRYLREILS